MAENGGAELYYRNSGKCSLPRLLLFLGLGILLTVPLALIYVAAVKYIPFVYLNALLAAGFGICCGLIASQVNLLGRNRSRGLAFVAALAVIAAGLWTAWGFWTLFMYEDTRLFSADALYTLQPRAIFFTMGETLKLDEYFSVSAVSFHGTLVAVLWSIEALLIAVVALACSGCFSPRPFCEQCGSWCKPVFLSRDLRAADRELLTAQIEARDFSGLCRLPQVRSEACYTLVELSRCRCGCSCFLTVAEVTVSYDSKENERKCRDEYISNFRLTPEEFDEIRGAVKPA